MKSRIASALVVAAAVVCGSPEVIAQDIQIYKEQVLRYLDENATVKFLLAHRYQPLANGRKTGYIRVGRGHYQDATFYLEEGYMYSFVGSCDEDCNDIDFRLIDPDGRELQRDSAGDDHPYLALIPSQSGTYRVRADVPNCTAPLGCYWGIAAFWK